MTWSGRRRRSARLSLLLIGTVSIAFVSVLSGCKSPSAATKMSTSEKDNFKGGPMPADFKPNIGSGPPPAASGTAATAPKPPK